MLCSGIQVELQKRLLPKENQPLKPEMSFIESFAGVVGSLWPSLAASLSLSVSEIEEVKALPQQDQAVQMLKKWVSREGATYGQLRQGLVTTHIF